MLREGLELIDRRGRVEMKKLFMFGFERMGE